MPYYRWAMPYQNNTRLTFQFIIVFCKDELKSSWQIFVKRQAFIKKYNVNLNIILVLYRLIVILKIQTNRGHGKGTETVSFWYPKIRTNSSIIVLYCCKNIWLQVLLVGFAYSEEVIYFSYVFILLWQMVNIWIKLTWEIHLFWAFPVEKIMY